MLKLRPLLPLFALMTACTAATSQAPDDEGDDIAATESVESAVSVTDTPGKAVWTKLWRWSTNVRPTIAADVATDGTGAQYLLRAFAEGDGTSAPRVHSMDVTRYSPTGEMVFRTSFDAPDVDQNSVHIGAQSGRIAVVSSQPTRSLVHLLNSAGTLEKELSLEGRVHVRDVAVDGEGATVIVGEVSGDANFGNGVLTDADPNSDDGFLVKLTRGGTVAVARRFEGGATHAVGVDGANAIYVASNGRLTSPAEGSQPSITKFSSSGLIVRRSAFTTSNVAVISHIDVSPGGRVAFAGNYHGRIELAPNVILENKYENKFGEPFFAKLDPDGTAVWGRAFSGNARRTVAGVGIDSYGQVVGTLNFTHNVEIGTNVSYSTNDSDDVQNLLFKFSAATGSVRWLTRYMGTHAVQNEVTAWGLAITSSDRIVMSGVFRKNVDFGKGPITGSLAGNGFLTRFHQ